MGRNRRVPRTLVLELLSRRGPMLRSEIPEALAGRVSDRDVDEALSDLLARGLIVRLQRITRMGGKHFGGGLYIAAVDATFYALADGFA